MLPRLKRFSAWAFGLGLALAGLAASAPRDTIPPVPPDLRYDFPYVPPAENAIVNWQRAGEMKVKLTVEEQTAIRSAWTIGAAEPTGAMQDRLNAWLQRHEEALRLFKESLQKPSAQWPVLKRPGLYPEIAAFSYLIRARLFQADQFAGQGNFTAAAHLLEDNLKLIHIGLTADPRLIDFILCNTSRTETENAILRLATRKAVPLPILKELLADLPSLTQETNIYVRTLSATYTADHDLPVDVRRMTSVWSKYAETNTAALMLPADMVRTFRVLIDPSLVALHPQPLDRVAELEQGARHLRIYRTNSLSPWSERSYAVEAEREADRTNLLSEVVPLMEILKDEPLPLSQAAAQRAGTAYRQIPNPVGRIFVYAFEYLDDSDIPVFRARTEREAVRTLLALLIFEKEKNRLPAKLSDLVEAQILDALPTDYFAAAPLCYDRDRRIVWSVSQNGIDDGGKGDKFLWLGDDAVWQIPNLN